ncbi:uncharacterized protein V1513DRAFT_285974 [Lipomyces chichibuensis]|uniref:uncharacterized protein n=1 Tax=Lipomyces chichibuensis TaxID=1546026 RepID=UPI0033441110
MNSVATRSEEQVHIHVCDNPASKIRDKLSSLWRDNYRTLQSVHLTTAEGFINMARDINDYLGSAQTPTITLGHVLPHSLDLRRSFLSYIRMECSMTEEMDLLLIVHILGPNMWNNSPMWDIRTYDTDYRLVENAASGGQDQKNLGRRSVNPGSLTEMAINQVQKCAEVSLYQTAILNDEIARLQEAVQQKEKKGNHMVIY